MPSRPGGRHGPYAGYHYNTLVQTVDQVNTAPGTQGKDDFWMKMYDGFAEDTWKLTPSLTVTRACATTSNSLRTPDW